MTSPSVTGAAAHASCSLDPCPTPLVSMTARASEPSADLDLDAVWQPNAAVIVVVLGVVLARDAAEALRKAARRVPAPD